MKRQPSTIRKLLAARSSGMTLKAAAEFAGIHIATACRWQAADPVLHKKLQRAARDGWRVNHPGEFRKPRVPFSKTCPDCGKRTQIRTIRHWIKYWRCSDWPFCRWRSWRPRAPLDCPCGGVMYWSHSRKSVSCDDCKMRICAPLLPGIRRKNSGRHRSW